MPDDQIGADAALLKHDDTRPRDFDWVRERYRCTTRGIFEELRTLAARDVQTANQLKTGARSEFDSGGSHSFSVVASHGRAGGVGLDFVSRSDAIEIRGNNETVVLTVTMDDAGRCWLCWGEERLEPWQVLRRALEPLFFPGTAS